MMVAIPIFALHISAAVDARAHPPPYNSSPQVIMHTIGLGSEPPPLWWATDLMLASPVGTPADDEEWVVSEVCVWVWMGVCVRAHP